MKNLVKAFLCHNEEMNSVKLFGINPIEIVLKIERKENRNLSKSVQ